MNNSFFIFLSIILFSSFLLQFVSSCNCNEFNDENFQIIKKHIEKNKSKFNGCSEICSSLSNQSLNRICELFCNQYGKEKFMEAIKSYQKHCSKN
ncbi:hypothetical protein M0811_12261 [Anaeramoeba ignava]|uniref:Uncharacterized protein n=1 Tax=Anaeramoeba ignava TaxID=1746090 RepID=A0A9Q0L959_ANAIG|nr:hypothetical protein M0811_12261 [Anaeramoeba ignava]